MKRALLFSFICFCLACIGLSFTPLSATGQGSSAWNRQNSGTTNELRSVHFVSEMEGWAAGANATLLKTADGGTKWNAVITGVAAARGFNSVKFLDRNIGWVGGATAAAKTLNGGANWTPALLIPPPEGFSNVVHSSFSPLSQDVIMSCGSGQNSLAPFTPYRVCIQYFIPSSGNITLNFGFSSEPATPYFGVYAFPDSPTTGWAVGGNGAISYYDRRAPNFRIETLRTSGTSEQLNSIQMMRTNNVTGWVVGNHGTILKTTNGDNAWTEQPSGTTANLRDVHFLNANRGCAVGDGGVILTTSDGGATWVPEPSGVTANLRSVFFVNENTGFAVGDNGTILKRGVATGPTTVATVSAASFSGGELTADSIAAAFGQGLATATVAAQSSPLPTVLDGVSVKVKDSAGTERAAPLFFVSPGQINYLIPPETANGTANVTVLRGDTVIATGTAQIASVAPGLFAANSNGQGVAAAVALRVRDGVQTTDPVARLEGNRFVPAPLDLGPEGDQVFLLLFGGGFRAASSLAAVTCTIGGVSVPVSFAGAAPGLSGVDQANVGPLPRSLAGRGEVDVVLMVDGKAANTVRIALK